jgi:GT2 family glycosyltransferase
VSNPLVDVVVVSYNSAGSLTRCLEPITGRTDTRVVVVDNASSDGSADVARALGAETIALDHNGGFAHGCNAGWTTGTAPFVLFLNPDARIEPASLEALVGGLRSDWRAAAAGPRILEDDGSLALSQRRFPRLRTSFAQALFLHRVLPGSSWTDEMVRDPRAYERAGHPDWLSGACLLVRRPALERIAGFDERFFLYREDIDLCRRLRALGHTVRYEPAAVVRHAGGASAPQHRVIPVLAASRVSYARKHHGAVAAGLERLAVGLHGLTHALFGRGGSECRAAHLRAASRPLKAAVR